MAVPQWINIWLISIHIAAGGMPIIGSYAAEWVRRRMLCCWPPNLEMGLEGKAASKSVWRIRLPEKAKGRGQVQIRRSDRCARAAFVEGTLKEHRPLTELLWQTEKGLQFGACSRFDRSLQLRGANPC